AGRPRPALSDRRHRLSHAPLRLPRGARHHRHDPGPARRAELPPGHDHLGRRLDGVLHPAALRDAARAGGARAVRAQALPGGDAAEARPRARRRVRRGGCAEGGARSIILEPSHDLPYGGPSHTGQQERAAMTMSIVDAAINLATALGLSAIIGFERQWRNRLAGLRTNSLVSLGAASFVIFAALVPGEASPTRVATQVVSGIGFLGAGLIFREGLNVRGLNTAATLWCSAAIGVLAGAGYLLYATLATGFVVFVNLLLRPIVTFINRQPLTSTELDMGYLVSVTCRSPDEAHV